MRRAKPAGRAKKSRAPKHYRPIVVDGAAYRWKLHVPAGYGDPVDQWSRHGRGNITVLREEPRGRVFGTAHLRWASQGPVRPSDVEALIRLLLREGWNPDGKKSFELKRAIQVRDLETKRRVREKREAEVAEVMEF